MAFIAGLIFGILGGALSWIGAAAWLESKRQQPVRGALSPEFGAAPIRRLYRQPSRS